MGTKRSISDFIGSGDDVADTSHLPKKSRPMTRAERAAVQAPTPSGNSLAERKTPGADAEDASSDSD